MNEFDIARLISRQRLDIQTPAEEKQLQEWLAASEENRKLFEQISTGNSFTKRKVLEEQTDINKEYKIMVQKMKRSRIRRWILGTASAAAILACGVMAAIFWIPDKSSQPQTVAMSSDNIELIFPNGKRFLLGDKQSAHDSLPEGFKLIQDESDKNKLAYTHHDTASKAPASFITLNVPKKEDYKIEIPDGTVVFLNACTSLRFPERFQADCREVYLSGEAAFSVKKDKTAPFHVHTDQGTITVTGTEFHVSAYTDDPFWQATLIEGAIEVTQGEKAVPLKPHQQYFWSKEEGTGHVRDIPDEEAILIPWGSGMLVFDAATFEEITRKLQRWYDITWNYENEAIKNKRFTATINKKESLEVFLRLIERTTDIRFILDGKQITITEKKLDNSTNNNHFQN